MPLVLAPESTQHRDRAATSWAGAGLLLGHGGGFTKAFVMTTPSDHTGSGFARKVFSAWRACKHWVVNCRIGEPQKATGKFPSGPGADTSGERPGMAPWMGGKIEAAKAQLDGMERKWRNDGTNAWNPQVGWLAGNKGTATRCLLCLLARHLHAKRKTFPDQ